MKHDDVTLAPPPPLLSPPLPSPPADVATLATPTMRSAAVLVHTDDGRLLVYGGDPTGGHGALADTWELGPPASGWEPCSCPDPEWTRWECGATANENVPTPRSNHAAVA
eukprot:2386055-Prymnesium_polylepis.1